MNILQILPELHVGGVETGTVDLAKYLVRMGHKAVVVSAGGELVKELEACGAVHYQLPVHKKSIVSIIKNIPRLEEIINKEEIHIVHARSRVPAWSAYFASRRTGRAFITTCHGYYKKHPFSYVMGWAKRVIVLSNVIARHMIEDFAVPLERIRLVPRSVDLEKFKYIRPDQKRKEDFNVGIIGRITPIKGHLYFIKAMAKVAKSVARLKIWIVGDAPVSKSSYKEELQVLVKRLGLWNYTQFLGTQRDIPAVLSNLDLLVMATTTQEAFGRVIVEAQACGVPVVATKVGGVVDVIDDGKTGLLVPAADPESMAEAILKVYKDKELSAGFAEAAYKKVQEEYNVELMVKNTLKVYEDALSSFKVLVIKLSSIGDVILSSAALRAIRDKFRGNGKITFLAGHESKNLLMNCPYIDELLVCDLKNKDRGIPGLLRLGRRLRKDNFDIVIDLQNNRNSHILSWLSFALDRYGYDNRKFGFLLNHRIKDERPKMDPVRHQFRVLKMLGIEPADPHLELWPSDSDREYIDEFFKSQWLSASQRLIGINLSSSSKWVSKNWPKQHVLKLCESLNNRDMRLVITGTQADSGMAQALLSKVKNIKPINACGKTTLNELACLIARCSVYISTDSAPLHIAAAMHVPFVALFGPTDPGRHMPYAKECVLIKKDLPCAPCYKPGCSRNRCMESITPQEVLDAVDKLLK
ncbi:MAG: lipopolysaccharide heptosyltransferase II [Candidatus Omnitrophica bacterium]|nr:lipopolysaccharide heptosyltransferase II [Candidatus Omnitrophota bacterium]